MTEYVITPPATPSVAVADSAARFAVRRIFCVGRNYAAHAREMGKDPDRENTDPGHARQKREFLPRHRSLLLASSNRSAQISPYEQGEWSFVSPYSNSAALGSANPVPTDEKIKSIQKK